MRRVEIDTARGKERVPPGQYLVGERFPILTAGPTPDFDIEEWDFRITGLAQSPLRFSWESSSGCPRSR